MCIFNGIRAACTSQKSHLAGLPGDEGSTFPTRSNTSSVRVESEHFFGHVHLNGELFWCLWMRSCAKKMLIQRPETASIINQS